MPVLFAEYFISEIIEQILIIFGICQKLLGDLNFILIGPIKLLLENQIKHLHFSGCYITKNIDFINNYYMKPLFFPSLPIV
jgi:hypothetical protein